MQTRSRVNSSASSCSSSSTPRKTRTKKSSSGVESPLDEWPISVKKRKIARITSSTSSVTSGEDRYLRVDIVDMLKDKRLCLQYSIHKKLENTLNNIETDSEITSRFSISSTDFNGTTTTSDEISDSSEMDMLSEERKIVLQDNLITITKNVTPQKFNKTVKKRCDELLDSAASSINDWDTWLKDNIKDYPKTWRKEYALADNEIYKISSKEKIFESAELGNNTTIHQKAACETVVTETQLKNGIPNIKVQIPNFTMQQSQFNDTISRRGSSISSTTSLNSSASSAVFKIPLPPAKRPPSRPRKISYSSSSSASNSYTELLEKRRSTKEPLEDDDALSISASTVLEVEPDHSEREEELVSETASNDSFQSAPFQTSTFDTLARNRDIQRWINTTNPPPPSLVCSPLVSPEIQISSDTSVNTIPDSAPTVKLKKKNQLTLPNVFRKMKLCKRHFSNNTSCTWDTCSFSHSIVSIKENEILLLDQPELTEAYKWTLSSSLFPHTFKAFAKRYSRLKDIKQLITMVDDILQTELYDRTPYIQIIVRALQNAGETFKDAITILITHHGFKSGCLPDILLRLVIDDEEHLPDNWIVIKEILKYEPYIDHNIVSEILKKTIECNNRELCKSVCEDICYLFNDFSNIDKELLLNFFTSLRSHKLCKQLDVMKSKTKNYLEWTAEQNKSSDTNSTVSLIFPTNGVQQEYHPTTSLSIPTKFQNGGTQHNNISELAIQTVATSNDKICCSEELDDNEICNLLHSLRTENINLFVALLNKCKSTEKVDSFALNTVVYFNEHQVDKQYFRWLKALELVYPGYMKDPATKSVIEQISYNVLDFLTRQRMWNLAYQLLLKFEDTLDTFVKSREFKKRNSSNRKLAERYLYICKIYINNRQYKKALRVFLRDDLNLLKPCSTWTAEYSAEAELYRDRIIVFFLRGTLEDADLKSARVLIHHFIEHIENKKTEKELWSFYNSLVIHMLNKKDKYKLDILHEFQKRIFRSWYRRLNKNVLRGLGVTLLQLKIIEEQTSIEFYNNCCKQGVYPQYDGTESAINITTDLMREEVYLTILSFLFKVAMGQGLPKDLKIHIECPDYIYSEPLILLNSDVGFTDMKIRITDVLVKAFGILIDVEEIPSIDRFIMIKEKHVVNCVRRLQKTYGIVG